MQKREKNIFLPCRKVYKTLKKQISYISGGYYSQWQNEWLIRLHGSQKIQDILEIFVHPLIFITGNV